MEEFASFSPKKAIWAVNRIYNLLASAVIIKLQSTVKLGFINFVQLLDTMMRQKCGTGLACYSAWMAL